MPYEGMTQHPHVVVFSELYELVSLSEIPYARSRLHYFSLEAVLRRDCIEMLEEQFVCLGQSAACVARIYCTSYHEAVRIGLLERLV